MRPNLQIGTFCSTIDCYIREKCIKVLGWIETLSREQDIYFEAKCLFKCYRALIAKKDNKELQQYREQQRKMNRSDGAYGNQVQKRSVSTES